VPAQAADLPGARELLLGNEAIARGALEAGVRVAAGYPGTPSTEVMEALARVAAEASIYVEWSVNEKVAAEVAAGAATTGLRALAVMKQEGLNVALDFLAHANLIGVPGGYVIVVSDDPEGWSSAAENDSRGIIRWLGMPLLEPSTAQEAKEMTRYAFDLSEELRLPVVIRGCTRVSHATGIVEFGPLSDVVQTSHLDTSQNYVPTPVIPKHKALLEKIDRVRELFEESPLNFYEGPENADLVVVAAGSSRLYAAEALEFLGLHDQVGILHIGTTYPLPERFILKHLARASRLLVTEEIDPFLEGALRRLAAEHQWPGGPERIYGKESGHLPRTGELTPTTLIEAVAGIADVEYQMVDARYRDEAQKLADTMVVAREAVWCPGCPHRASLWSIKNAMKLDGRDGVVTGDIGCYALDRRGVTGYNITRTASAMGSGAGIASGLGKLRQFGNDQPVVALCGDSTFFHSAVPALINAQYNRSNFVLALLDNGATALTGFQTHAGVGRNAMGAEAPKVDVEVMSRATGATVEVVDPYGVDESTDNVVRLMQSEAEGVKVLVFRHPCALLRPRDAKPDFQMAVDPERCLGEACGCARFCIRVFKCPGLGWDMELGKARIDEAVCIGCGVCASICPQEAITKEPYNG
jgi:indolepyruvate ferredoxin oxidoreductase alpha subunit